MATSYTIDNAITHLRLDGIAAAFVRSELDRASGDESWRPLAESSLDLLAKVPSTARKFGEQRLDVAEARVVVGKYTIRATRVGKACAVVVLPTGHPVAKTIRRTTLRALASLSRSTSKSPSTGGGDFDADITRAWQPSPSGART